MPMSFEILFDIRLVLVRLVVIMAMVFIPAGAWGVTIELWTTEEEPDRMASIRYLADNFMAFHDDIRISVIAVNENEIPYTFADAVEAGKSPDMLNAGAEALVAFSSKGWLDGGMAADMADDIGRGRFFSGALDMVRAAGKDLHALPFHGWVQGVWYRADWFEEHGLNPPDTIENVLAAARVLHDPEKGVYGLLVGTKRDMYTEQCFTHLALGEGIRLVDDSGQLVFDNKRTVQLLESYRELASYAPEGPQNWRARDFYIQGRLAMMFYSTFIMDDLAVSNAAASSLTGDHFEELQGADFDPGLLGKTAMVSVLKGRRSASYGMINGLGFAVGMDEEKRNAVMKFVQYLYKPDVYVTWLQMAPGGMLPVLRDVVEGEEFYRDSNGVFRRYSKAQMRRIIAGLDEIDSFSMHDGKMNARASRIAAAGIIPNMIHKAVFKDVEPAKAVKWAVKEMERIE